MAIIAADGFKISKTNTPTREGERIATIAEITDREKVPNPSVGMQIFVEDEQAHYTVLELGPAEIGGIEVPNLVVKRYEKVEIKDGSISKKKLSSDVQKELETLNSQITAAADIGVDSITLLQGGIDSDGSENISSYLLRTGRFSTFKLEVNSGYTIGQLAQYDLVGNFVALYSDYTQIPENVEWTPTSVVAADKEYMWVAIVFKGSSPSNTPIDPREAVVKTFVSGLFYFMQGGESDPQSAAQQAKMVVNKTIEQLPNEEDLTLVDEKMQLANRAAVVKDGKVANLGYVILRQEKSLAAQVVDANTIYEVRYEYSIDSDFSMPNNCSLKFNGGKINGNGILNLNNGKVEGDGLNCNIINPFNKTINSSQVEIIDEEQHNADRLEFLVQKGIKVVFNTNATFSRAIKSHRYKIDSLGSHTLSFSSSSGLTFVDNTKSVYSANNEIKNVNIISQGNCIDFCDEEGNRPANVYWSKFSNLNLKSENGYCIYAGDNKGGTGDQLVFNCDFEDIKVSAGISGFYGLNGIQIVFKEVKDEYCVVATFEDCAGKFDSFNGTFAFEKKTTPTFLKANANKEQRLYSEFNKCNFEDYSGVLFDCNQPETFCHFSFTNCQIYISKTADTIIDKAPFQFHYLYNLVWNNNRVLHFGQYATGVALMNIVNHIDTSYTGDTKIPIIGNGYSVDLKSVPSTRKSAVLIPAEYGKKYLPSTEGMVFNEVHTELIHTKIKKVNIVSNKVDLWNASAIGLTVTNDVEGEVYLDYFDAVSPYSRIHRSILLYNNNSNATIVIRHKLGYDYRFECEDEANIKLKPKECVEAVLDIQANASNGKCIIKSRVQTNRLPVVDDIQGVKSLGYKVLLGDRDFASQVTEANTIYEIRYNFDLGGGTVTLKEGCTLKFVGGKVKNGTLKVANIIISTNDNDRILDNIVIDGTIYNYEIEAEWFGELSTEVDSAIAINRAIAAAKRSNVVMLPRKNITVATPIIINKSLDGRHYNSRVSGHQIKPTTSGMSVFVVSDGFYDGRLMNVSISAEGTELERNYIGVEMLGCESYTIHNVKVNIADIAYKLETASQISLPRITNIEAHKCNTGVLINGIDKGWTNGIYIRPTWFTNNYIHFDIRCGSGTTIQGGNTEIGNGGEQEWFGENPRGFLIGGKSMVNIFGSVWGENIDVYLEAKDYADVNIYGETVISGSIVTKDYANIHEYGSRKAHLHYRVATKPVDNIMSLPLYYFSAGNAIKDTTSSLLHPIQLVDKEIYPNWSVRVRKPAGIPVFSSTSLTKKENPTLLTDFSLILKIKKVDTEPVGIKFSGGSYFDIREFSLYLYGNLGDGAKTQHLFFLSKESTKTNTSDEWIVCVMFDRVNNKVYSLTPDGSFDYVDAKFDLASILVEAENISFSLTTNFVSDFVCFDKILTAEEARAWVDKLKNDSQSISIGSKRPDTAPIGHQFFDTQLNKLIIKTAESYSSTNLTSVTWVDSAGTAV